MLTSGVKTKLPAAYLSYWIVRTILAFLFIFLIVAGFLFLIGIVTAMPGAVSTETINGVQQTVPASPFPAGIAIGIAAAVLVIVAFLSFLYKILYCHTFSFTVSDGRITVVSGILFTSEKSTQFEEVQTVSVKSGPLLRSFGLGILQGFTASPDQIQVHYNNKGGSYTTYRPDVNVTLSSEDAEALRSQISSSVKKVQVVTPVAA